MPALLKRLDRWLNVLYLISGYIAAGFMVLLAVLVITSIVTRLIGTFIPGLNAYSGYTLAATTFLGLAYTFKEGGHIRVAILRTALRGKVRLAVEIWCHAVGAFFACYLAWFLLRMTWVSYKFNEKSEGIDATPLWMPQLIMAIGATLVGIAVTHALVKLLITMDPQSVEAAPDMQLREH